MKKIIFLATGIIFLILGIIGLILPVIPQVPFLIAAALLLMRGSDRIHRRIVNSRIYREYILPQLEQYDFLLRFIDPDIKKNARDGTQYRADKKDIF